MLSWLRRKNTALNEVVTHFAKVPYPPPGTLVAQSNFLALDLELTGLNPRKDHIVSIGWVPVRAREIVLAEAKHYLISSPVSVGQSAVFHGVHDHDLKQGCDLAQVLIEFFTVAAGAVLVAHHAKIEQQFLTVACQRLFGKAPRLRFVDTMALEWQRLQQQGKVFKSRDLQLNACLERHQLPTSQQHHALSDAFSCALLLLCQLKQSRDPDRLLADLYKMSRM